MNRRAIAAAIQVRAGLAERPARALVSSIIEGMVASLSGGENVLITGFGTFHVCDVKPRLGRNPKTGEAHDIRPHRTVRFRASDKLRSEINDDRHLRSRRCSPQQGRA